MGLVFFWFCFWGFWGVFLILGAYSNYISLTKLGPVGPKSVGNLSCVRTKVIETMYYWNSRTLIDSVTISVSAIMGTLINGYVC